MSVPSVTAAQSDSLSATRLSRAHTSLEKTASPASAPSRDSVSLSDSAMTAYRTQTAVKSAANASEPTRSVAATPTAMRELSSQMRRLSIEAAQAQSADQSDDNADAGGQDVNAAAPPADSTTADEPAQLSFTPLAEGAEAMTPDSGESSDKDSPAHSNADPTDSSDSANTTAVDSQADLSLLDHALGKISHSNTLHGASFSSLSEATRLSVKQRESIAVAHSEGGSHELASAASQTGRAGRVAAKPATATQLRSSTPARESKTYTRPARKA